MVRYIHILLLALSCTLAHAAEIAKPVFDKRNWELAWSKNPGAAGTGGLVFDEYTLKGEKIDNWSELVSVQFFPGLNKNVTLEVFEMDNKLGLLQTCPKIQWRSLSQSKNERMWAWTAKGCPGISDQSEVIRAVTTDAGVHVFHYGIKKAPMPTQTEKTWVKNLKAIKIQ